MKHALLVLAFAGCASTSSGATCPTANAPTYDSFGKQFFATYCTGCHSASSTDRHGAPKDLNYDTEADIRAHAMDIDLVAASGPSATNTKMPELTGAVRVQPTEAEREQLGQFLACENK
jgi:uncharacterized membrane protein